MAMYSDAHAGQGVQVTRGPVRGGGVPSRMEPPPVAKPRKLPILRALTLLIGLMVAVVFVTNFEVIDVFSNIYHKPLWFGYRARGNHTHVLENASAIVSSHNKDSESTTATTPLPQTLSTSTSTGVASTTIAPSKTSKSATVEIGAECVTKAIEGFRLVGYGHTQVAKCSHPLCALNKGRSKVIVRPKAEKPCARLSDCVTVLVKTAARMLNIVTLIKSIRQHFARMRIVVADEYHNVTSEEFKSLMLSDVNLTYVQGTHGIGQGRNTALKLVTTK